MRFYDFSPERKLEYKRRIQKIKERTPDFHEPSEAARECLVYAMGLRYYKEAINMAAELGDTKLCEHICKENQIYRNHPDVVNARCGKRKWTPLMNAVNRRRLGTAEWLLQHGAKIMPCKGGHNPVLQACFQGCVPALNMFKYHGVDFNKPFVVWIWGKESNFLPHRCVLYPIWCTFRSPKAFQWMIDNGMSIDVKFQGETLRERFKKRPDSFNQACQQILTKKILEESEKAVKETQKKVISTQPKKTFWQRLSFGRTKE